MRDWSRMAVVIRPDIHARFQRVLGLAQPAPLPPEPVRRHRPPPMPTKLSTTTVQAIRALRQDGVTLEALAQRFHVAVSTVSRAANGTTWRSVPPAPADVQGACAGEAS